MSYLLILIGLVIMPFFFWVPIRLEVNFERQQEEDNLDLKLSILFIDYKLNLSYLEIKKLLSLPTLELEGKLNSNLIDKIVVTEKLDQTELQKLHKFFKKSYKLNRRVKTFLLLTHNCQSFLWKTSFGLANPAHTGLATGSLWAIKSSIIGILQEYLEFKSLPCVQVNPNFNWQQPVRIELKGIFEFKIGNIMYVGIKIICYEIKRRIK
ncbi:DUF2953 domain-containing protein [Natroniella sulfidigena]|uniref:DUF2953 domain-containing protein n=1 Tax=Natroniella sulfidigena TaxID=723921 RepID=UPI00200A07F5|nr:DUF2953 domain-containing protein [Natroniella sulfidigena]MCK8816571.1 DUF2953 domain-containing protein [Natroniella sulfidigena]